jgi:hypothetical protein
LSPRAQGGAVTLTDESSPMVLGIYALQAGRMIWPECQADYQALVDQFNAPLPSLKGTEFWKYRRRIAREPEIMRAFLNTRNLRGEAGLIARAPFVDRWLLSSQLVGDLALVLSLIWDLTDAAIRSPAGQRRGGWDKIFSAMFEALAEEYPDVGDRRFWRNAFLGVREARKAAKAAGVVMYGRHQLALLNDAIAFQLRRTPAPGEQYPMTLDRTIQYMIACERWTIDRVPTNLARTTAPFDAAFGVQRQVGAVGGRPQAWSYHRMLR